MSAHHGILLHIVFSTKYRRPVLHVDWRDKLYGYFGGIARGQKGVLLEAGGIEDHVHLLVRTDPQFAISKTIQLLKANSSRWINETQKTCGKFQWQRGYGAFSVSHRLLPAVANYIRGQVEHHQRTTFEDEYRFMLDRHGIEYDPRYVFEREIVS